MVVSREAKKKQQARMSTGPCNHHSELFVRIAAVKFKNTVTQLPKQYRLLKYRPSTL